MTSPRRPVPWPRLEAATAHLPAPVAALDLPALLANADELVARAQGRPVRVATKSVRSRRVLAEVLARPGFRGLMAFTLAEALWLAEDHGNVLVGYPTADREALGRLLADEDLARRVTLVVDDPAQVDLVDAVAPPHRRPEVRVCLDVDASLRLPGLHVGVRRSPVHTVAQARAAAQSLTRRPGVRLVGLLAYEAQLAGVGDRLPPGAGPATAARTLVLRRLQRASWDELRERRSAVVAAVREVAGDLELVNGGGTGSLHLSGTDPALTEVAAGSGLFGPALFDGYRAFRPLPALGVALDVVRRPTPGTVTLAGGGWPASGPPGPDRLPTLAWPPGLAYLGEEGAGEVQTPVTGPGASRLAVGDRVWVRHAKAGEVCERVDALHVVDGDGRLVGAWPTYRGEGRAYL